MSDELSAVPGTMSTPSRPAEIGAARRFSRHRTPVARLPLVVRTRDDVALMLRNPRLVRKLPAQGIHIAVEGLDRVAAERLRTATAAYVRACGCAAGGVSALLSLLIVVIALGSQMLRHGLRWSDPLELFVGVVGAVLLGGGLGKAAGMAAARARFMRTCRQVIAACP